MSRRLTCTGNRAKKIYSIMSSTVLALEGQVLRHISCSWMLRSAWWLGMVAFLLLFVLRVARSHTKKKKINAHVLPISISPTVFSPGCTLKSPGKLWKIDIQAPSPRDSPSVSMRWSLGFCIFSSLQGWNPTKHKCLTALLCSVDENTCSPSNIQQPYWGYLFHA